MERLPITRTGYAALEEELKWRQQVERPRVIEMLSEARAPGEPSENSEYYSAQEDHSKNESRILELESMIARTEIFDVAKLNGDTVKFGATVKVVDGDTEEESTYQIVGEPEADVRSGRVSVSSPIGRALIGKSPGDIVEVATPAGGKSYEIIEIAFR